MKVHILGMLLLEPSKVIKVDGSDLIFSTWHPQNIGNKNYQRGDQKNDGGDPQCKSDNP